MVLFFLHGGYVHSGGQSCGHVASGAAVLA